MSNSDEIETVEAEEVPANKYSRGKIYMIYSLNNLDLIYYGSTIEPLSVRLAKHRSRYKMYLQDNTKGFCTSYEILELDDYKIELVENFPCESKEELNKREGYFIRNNKCVNVQIPGRTVQEWRDENKTIIAEKQKDYYEENKIIIAEKKNVKFVCECGGKYTQSNRAVHFKSKKHQSYEEEQLVESLAAVVIA